MADINVNEYIRTNTGKIGKIIRIEFDKVDKSLKWYVFWGKDEFGIERELYINKPYILKHSKNIIDLIEVGDAIKYVEQTEGKDGTELYGIYITDIHNEVELTEIKQELKQNGIKILSIVTKEQFEAMSYRLEG